MVFDRDDFDLLEVEAELYKTPFNTLLVTVVAAVAGEDGVKRAVRRVKITFGVVPAGFFKNADWRKRNGYRVNISGLDSCLLQTEFCRFVGHAALGVFVADEAFLFGGGNELAVNVECCRRIVCQRAG